MYTLGEKLHEGGRAAVYRAVRNADGHAIVLKVLDPKHCRPQDVQRLKNELALGPALDGLSVLEPFGLSTFEGRPALELEPFGGNSLEAMAGAPMPLEAFLGLAVRIAAAVADIHERGLVHKDLKPSNILRRRAKRRDQDRRLRHRLARRAASTTTLHPARLIEGSLPYVSPEQTGRMNRAIDSRSDLYSLGVTFYQLLTGRLPFEATDPVGWIHCHVARKPPPPDEIVPGCRQRSRAIVLKLLAKVPDDRYQSAAGLEHDLERCLRPMARDRPDRALLARGARRLRSLPHSAEALWPRARKRGAARRVRAGRRPRHVRAGARLGLLGNRQVGASCKSCTRSIVSRRGPFLAGKFEQYKRETPVLHDRPGLPGAGPRPPRRERRARSRTGASGSQCALGQNGQLIVDVVPQVELVIGPQPPVPELPLTEAREPAAPGVPALHRRLRAARSTRSPSSSTTCSGPIAASLELLDDLVADSDTRHLLLIGAYRDNEVDAAHPLTPTLDEVRKSGARGPGPRARAAVGGERRAARRRHAPRCPSPRRRRWRDLVHEKTGGNPFFAIQFLTSLHHMGSSPSTALRPAGAGTWRRSAPRASPTTSST